MSPMRVLNKAFHLFSLNLYCVSNEFSIHAVEKKEEIKEVIKSDKKKKSESGTDEPPPKKSKSSEEGKVVSFPISKTI